jgi:HlyD family secretion protein
VAQTRARVSELQASLNTAELPARPDERAAAQAQAQAASAALRQANGGASRSSNARRSMAGGRHLFRPGEYVGAGQPVLSLLPPAGIKARFYVPEAEVGRIRTGERCS